MLNQVTSLEICMNHTGMNHVLAAYDVVGWGANFLDMTKYYFSLFVPVEVAQNKDYLLL
ncbi:hypothetical protein PRUPE_4G250900 [Prunus persica]|uniref:Uncharacterized protein n=1 Tax=Prunus persica TaxID=3760 RepID=A0A251PQK9_PRUPE|nr:hypothetical protein PRUPE_4G250900 [Prunus persica]